MVIWCDVSTFEAWSNLAYFNPIIILKYTVKCRVHNHDFLISNRQFLTKVQMRWWSRLQKKKEGDGKQNIKKGDEDMASMLGWLVWWVHLIFITGKSISLSFPGRTVISAKRCSQNLPARLHLAVRRCCFASAASTKPRWHTMWNYLSSHWGIFWLWSAN